MYNRISAESSQHHGIPQETRSHRRSGSGALNNHLDTGSSLSNSIRESHRHFLHGDSDEEEMELLRRTPDPANTAAIHPNHPALSVPANEFSLPLESATSRSEDEKSRNALEVKPAALKMWNPFFLRRTVLVLFVLLFAIMTVALGLLYHFSLSKNGISTQISTNQYSWTYGPTAVLVLVISVWSQVDFWTKALTPWQEMRHHPCSAKRSLLLDYISANVLVTMWQALQNRHWAILSASGATLLLRLMTIFSTSLLVLQPSQVTNHNVSMARVTRFDDQGFRDLFNMTPGNAPFSPAPALNYAGMLKYGLSYPVGTTTTAAYLTIEPPDTLPRNAKTVVDTVGFYSKLDCEVPKLDGNISFFPYASRTSTTTISVPYENPITVAISFSIDNCSFVRWSLACNPLFETCPDQEVVTTWSLSDTILYPTEKCVTAGNDTGIVFAVADLRHNYTETDTDHPDPTGNATLKTKVAKLTGLFCKPRYFLKDSTIELNPRSADNDKRVTLTGRSDARETQLSNFSPLNLTYAILESFNIGPAIFGNNSVNNFVFSYITDKAGMYNFMKLVNGNVGSEAFLDQATLMKSADTAFQGLAAQVAQTYLLAPVNETIIGEAKYLENRLHVKALTVWLMSAGLILTMLAGLIVLLFRPVDVVSRDPTSAAAIGAIMASSRSLSDHLRGTGSGTIASLSKLLSTSSYVSVIQQTGEKNPKFMIEEKHRSPVPHSAGIWSWDVNSSQWWRPFALRRPFLFILSSLLIVLIVVLEILQRFSDHNKGLVDINLDSDIRFVASVIPAALMSVISIIFSSMDLNIRIITPYKTLHRGSVPARRSILRHYSGKGTISSILDAIRYRHLPVVLSSFTVLLASLLTIFISGLYVREDVATMMHIELERADQFNLSWVTNSDQAPNDTAGALLTLVRGFNLSYPRFTFEELAFPSLQLPSNNDSVSKQLVNASSLPLETRIPALRASLNCTSVPQRNINVSYEELGQILEVDVYAQVPPECKLGGVFQNQSYLSENKWFDPPDKNQSFINFNTGFQAPELSEWAYRGKMVDLYIDPNALFTGSSGVDTPETIQENVEGCPNLAFYFGSYNLNATSSENSTVLTCTQYVEEIEIDTTFTLPALDVDTVHPPIPDDSTATIIENGTPGSIYRQYRLENAFETEVAGSQMKQYQVYTSLDHFFTLLANQSGGVDPADLLGPANVDRLFNATQHLYRMYMAQAMSLNNRIRIKDTPDVSQSSSDDATADAGEAIIPTRSSFPGTVTGLTRIRLKQDRTSKLLLQITMGCCLLLSALACFTLGDLRHVLPHNPCSIAGVASLLAGGELVSSDRKIIPGGAEWMDDKEWSRRGIFEGWVFGLGWWNRREDGEGETDAGTAVGGAHCREIEERRIDVEEEERNVHQREESGATYNRTALRGTAKASGPQPTTVAPNLVQRRHYGIDVGRPERSQDD